MGSALKKLACSVVLVTLAGCTEYVDRQETISFAAGNAVAHNRVVHMIDPWPVHAKNTAILSSGERAARAVKRYEDCYRREPEGSAGTTTFIRGGLTCVSR